MISSYACIHCPFDIIAFFPLRGGREDVVLVSSPQLRLPRKLIVGRAKIDSALDGSLHEDRGSTLVDVNENSPHLPYTERPAVTVSATPLRRRLGAEKLKAVLRVSEAGISGSLPPHTIYLLELGLNLEQIKVMAYKFPNFSYYTLEGNIRPLIEFLLDLGVPKSDIPNILIRFPRLCGMSVSENLIPSMAFLETLGVDKSKWVKLISRYPSMLAYSRKKIEAMVEFLREVGLSEENIGKILTRCPQILGNSVDGKLRPLAEYLQSLGADVAAVLRSCPSTICLSIEDNLKPSTEFFLENEFSIEEVGTMISRFGYLYAYSLKGNMVPKWEFFLTMDYPRQDLVRFPHYFSYSLEDRIKPRYNLMTESGVKLSLSQLLSTKGDKFELLLKKKIQKLQLED